MLSNPNYKILLVCISIMFASFNPTSAFSEESNPYLELYRLRVQQAELNEKRQIALATLANSRMERMKKLYAKNAVSLEEYETRISEAKVSEADLELSRKRIKESKAYLRIVEALVKRGVSIPLCTYEME